ncbi:ie-1 [Artaxa digramma nucleopolyhedrovirus]|uniref:Ie-1 n=1 Tax=Artaxa digramma nucleopolyhedrovirus TaxID=3070910 RepID=A0AAE6UZQ0_9ABAC|nr:ie-1 [Euproctis digramma nucleopolyhedrovirus]QHB21667.1 ie-1 [Artaxa digramma nucleopolyhedrovirus]
MSSVAQIYQAITPLTYLNCNNTPNREIFTENAANMFQGNHITTTTTTVYEAGAVYENESAAGADVDSNNVTNSLTELIGTLDCENLIQNITDDMSVDNELMTNITDDMSLENQWREAVKISDLTIANNDKSTLMRKPNSKNLKVLFASKNSGYESSSSSSSYEEEEQNQHEEENNEEINAIIENACKRKSSEKIKRKIKKVKKDKNVKEKNNTIDDVNDEKKKFFNKKNRGRYRKPKIESSVELKKVEPSSLLMSEQEKITHAYFNKHIVMQHNNAAAHNNDYVADRRFVDHMSNTSYYMFVVCKSRNSPNQYRLFYANCVNSVTVEYTNRYIAIDNMVMVVSFDKFRFMISYELLKHMEIDIPQSEDFNEKTKNATNKECFFNEVKDFEFLKFLTNTFCLDMIYTRAKITLLMASLGEQKARYLLEKIGEMDKDKSLYALPFNFNKNENLEEPVADVDSISQYVQNVVNYTKNIKFKILSLTRDSNSKNVALDMLKLWLRDKRDKNSKVVTHANNKKDFFTYKYGSIVRLFYNENDSGFSKLLKIKKENNCNGNLIMTYLNISGVDEQTHNCLMVTTKSDERITIIKYEKKYIWITSIIKDILPMDLIETYKKHEHHVFNLNKSFRKEINNKHNGMIKLISFYTGHFLTFKEILQIAINDFECNYSFKNYGE